MNAHHRWIFTGKITRGCCHGRINLYTAVFRVQESIIVYVILLFSTRLISTAYIGRIISFLCCTTKGNTTLALNALVLKVEAKHSSRSLRKSKGKAAQGLPRDLFPAQRTKFMLTSDLWSEVEFVNGFRGEDVDITWSNGTCP